MIEENNRQIESVQQVLMNSCARNNNNMTDSQDDTELIVVEQNSAEDTPKNSPSKSPLNSLSGVKNGQNGNSLNNSNLHTAHGPAVTAAAILRRASGNSGNSVNNTGNIGNDNEILIENQKSVNKNTNQSPTHSQFSLPPSQISSQLSGQLGNSALGNSTLGTSAHTPNRHPLPNGLKSPVVKQRDPFMKRKYSDNSPDNEEFSPPEKVEKMNLNPSSNENNPGSPGSPPVQPATPTSVNVSADEKTVSK